MGLDEVGFQMSRPTFGNLAAAGVPGAKEEDASFGLGGHAISHMIPYIAN
jgi:hypothetical protein